MDLGREIQQKRVLKAKGRKVGEGRTWSRPQETSVAGSQSMPRYRDEIGDKAGRELEGGFWFSVKPMKFGHYSISERAY